MFKRFGIAWFLWRIAAAAALAVVLACGPAWGFAAWEQRKAGAFHNPHGSNVWAWERVTKAGSDPITSFVRVFAGAPAARRDYSKFGTSLIEFGDNISPFIGAQGWTFGWPFRCLRFGRMEAPPSFPGSKLVRTSAWINGWQVEPAAGTIVILPLRPLWPGMAWNLAIWGTVSAGLLLGLPLASKFLRRRRGQCAACGYDMNSLGPGASCPECGHGRDRVQGPGTGQNEASAGL